MNLLTIFRYLTGSANREIEKCCERQGKMLREDVKEGHFIDKNGALCKMTGKNEVIVLNMNPTAFNSKVQA